MRDLNNLYYFASVVRHGGFTAAGRILGLPKSKLSKHVALLEGELGVRLIERSSRRFRVTEVGASFFAQCEAVLAGVENAETAVATARAEPQGLVRVSCPPGLTFDLIARILPEFMTLHPLVRMNIKVTGLPVDLIEEKIDVAIRARAHPEAPQSSLIMRQLGQSRLILVASPLFLQRLGQPVTINNLGQLPTLSTLEEGPVDWRLVNHSGDMRTIRHQPRLRCADYNLIRAAAIQGTGIALLPEAICYDALRSGDLEQVVPEWSVGFGTVYAVFTNRKGLLPGVRFFIDFLADRVPKLLRDLQHDGVNPKSPVRLVRKA